MSAPGRADLDQAAATARNAAAELEEVGLRLARIAQQLHGEPAQAVAALYFARMHTKSACKRLHDVADILYGEE